MRKNRFTFLLFAFAGALFLWLFSYFLKSIVVASLLVLATTVFARKLDEKLGSSSNFIASKNKEVITASVLTLALGIIMFLPAGYFIVYAINDLASFDMARLFAAKDKLEVLLTANTFLSQSLKASIISSINNIFSEDFWILRAHDTLLQASGFITGIANSLAELAMIIVFFFLIHWFRRDLASFVWELVPISHAEKEAIASEMTSALSVVFLTLVGVMVAQGFAFFALMLFFDFNAPMLGFFTALSSVVPLFGTALVWVPVAATEFVNGDLLGAIIISVYSWFVMAFLIDNFVRLYLLNRVTKMIGTGYKINEFVMFFSIAAGIVTFGFWGFIIGPSIAALFLSSAKLYKNSIARGSEQ